MPHAVVVYNEEPLLCTLCANVLPGKVHDMVQSPRLLLRQCGVGVACVSRWPACGESLENKEANAGGVRKRRRRLIRSGSSASLLWPCMPLSGQSTSPPSARRKRCVTCPHIRRQFEGKRGRRTARKAAHRRHSQSGAIVPANFTG